MVSETRSAWSYRWKDGHRQGGNLPFRDSIVTNTIDKGNEFLRPQRMTIAFYE